MEETHGVIDELLHGLKVGPEVLTPSQYFGSRHTQDPFLAERKLIAAAFRSHLEDWRVAHLEWRLHPSPTRRDYWKRELTLWFTDKSEAPLSFLWYCDILHLDAQAVRTKLFSHDVGKIDQINHIGTSLTRMKGAT